MSDLAIFTKTADFAARAHRDQRRKNKEAAPYINHPIGVAYLATSIGGVTDIVIVQACLLHDTIEDTGVTYEEVLKEFGKEVADVVQEVTDDKTLSKTDRKRAQIEHYPQISKRAQTVKLCDKLYNLLDIIRCAPNSWSRERIQGYFVWAKMVLSGATGVNEALEKTLHDKIWTASFVFEGDGKSYPCCPDHIDEAYIFPAN